MKPRKPLPRVSNRQRKLLVRYNRAVKAWWSGQLWSCERWPTVFGYKPLCNWPGCNKPAGKRPHHIIPRSVRPDLICEPMNFAGTCQKHHDYAHSHPAEAYKIGFMGRSTDKLSDLWKRLLGAQNAANQPKYE